MCSRASGAVDLDFAVAARLAEVSHRGDRAHEEAAHKGLRAALIHDGPQHQQRGSAQQEESEGDPRHAVHDGIRGAVLVGAWVHRLQPGVCGAATSHAYGCSLERA